MRFKHILSGFIIASFIYLPMLDHANHRLSKDQLIEFMAQYNFSQDPNIQNHPYSFVLSPNYVKTVNFYQGSLISKAVVFIFWSTTPNLAAITFGNNIYLSDNTSLLNLAMVSHELVHTAQYRKEGVIPMEIKYTWHWLTKGYREVPYEKEAYEFQELVLQTIFPKWPKGDDL